MANPVGFIVMGTNSVDGPGNDTIPVKIYNNTFLNTTNTALTNEVSGNAGNLNLQVHNNIIDQPLGSYRPDAPLDVYGRVVPPDMYYNEMGGSGPDGSYGMDPQEGDIYEPADGSPAKQSSNVAQATSSTELKRNFTTTPLISTGDRDRGAVQS